MGGHADEEAPRVHPQVPRARRRSPCDELARTLSLEVGKPIRQSRNELNGLLGRIDFFLAETERTLRDEKVFADAQSMEERIGHEPLGVIANISAWNYPYFVGGNVFVPALAAGNAVLYKPSEFATLTGMHIADMLHAAGVPDDVFIAVIGDGKTGAALLKQPVDGVFFTGSYATGAKIAASTGKRMIKTQLELGGKDPIYVVRRRRRERGAAAAVADGAFYNTGQSCCSVERVYVHEKIYDAFVEGVRRRGQGLQDGRSARRRDVHRRDHAQAAARRPEEAGRRREEEGREAPDRRRARSRPRATGSRRRCSPTSTTTMSLMRDESFGPIIGLRRSTDDDAAVALMNDTEYGLTAGVYTADEKRARSILRAGQCRHRLLELLRPREPAAALVGRQALRHRTDAVDLRHPDVHAAEGVALAQRVGACAGSRGPRAAPAATAPRAACWRAASRSSSVPRRPAPA